MTDSVALNFLIGLVGGWAVLIGTLCGGAAIGAPAAAYWTVGIVLCVLWNIAAQRRV